jgi:hypothetical protein
MLLKDIVNIDTNVVNISLCDVKHIMMTVQIRIITPFLKVLEYTTTIVFQLSVLDLLLFSTFLSTIIQGHRGRHRMVVGFTTTCAISAYITSKVEISNPVHDEVYSIQHYVIKFVSDLRQVGGFLWVLRFPPPMKLTATI